MRKMIARLRYHTRGWWSPEWLRGRLRRLLSRAKWGLRRALEGYNAVSHYVITGFILLLTAEVLLVEFGLYGLSDLYRYVVGAPFPTVIATGVFGGIAVLNVVLSTVFKRWFDEGQQTYMSEQAQQALQQDVEAWRALDAQMNEREAQRRVAAGAMTLLRSDEIGRVSGIEEDVADADTVLENDAF